MAIKYVKKEKRNHMKIKLYKYVNLIYNVLNKCMYICIFKIET